jgi:hypothetical protein
LIELLLAALAAAVAGSTAAAARAILDLVERRARRWRISPLWVVYLWPGVLVAVGLVLAFIWNPASARFPAPGFYSLAAEVIPVLLIALVVERDVVASLPRGIRIEYAIVLILSEVAAFVGASGSFGDPFVDELVGGSYWFTGVLATLTSTGLLASVVLVVLAVVVETNAIRGAHRDD